MPPIKKTLPPEQPPTIDVTPIETPTMELTVTKNIQEFEWNFDEIKGKLCVAIARYNGLLVTEENLPEMEKTHREIAGLRIRVDKFRIETKRQLAEPANQFDAEVKELTEIIRQAEIPIRNQILHYEAERVRIRSKELLDFAQSTAASLGVREENFRYQVPVQLTNRTKTDAAARKEVITAVEEMKTRQDADDRAKIEAAKRDEERLRLSNEREAVLAMLCKTISTRDHLKTMVTVDDVKPLINPDMTPQQLERIVEIEVMKRAKIETAAEQPPIPAPPQMGPPPVFQPGPPPMPPTISAPLPPPPMQSAPQLYDVTLKFPGVSVLQASDLRQWLAINGIKYEVISQDKVGETNG